MGNVVAGLWKLPRLHGSEESLAMRWRRKDRSDVTVSKCAGVQGSGSIG